MDHAAFLEKNINENVIKIDFAPHAEFTISQGENYSKLYHHRLLKHKDSTVTWSTGLLKVPFGNTIEVDFMLLTNGRNVQSNDIKTRLIHYKGTEINPWRQ